MDYTVIMKKGMVFLFWFSILFFSSFITAADSLYSDQTVKLQVYLDKNNFSPGKIDGVDGPFTRFVFSLLDKTSEEEKANLKYPISTINPLYTEYKIKEADKKFIGKVPKTPKQQSQKKFLPYASYGEFVAERFHSDTHLLKTINPGKNINTLKAGDILKVPNVEPFVIEELKPKSFAKQKPEFAKRVIKINSKQRILRVYENEALLAVFPVTPGSTELPAPKGVWKIVKITFLPWFRYDEKMLNKGKRSKYFFNIPPGPNNQVGVVWISLNKSGIGIHGTDNPETIGRSTSHGCIRLTNWDALKLSKLISPGVEVKIDVNE